MPETAYGIQNITKGYYENITSKNNKNTSGNTKIITGPISRPFTSFRGGHGGGITAAPPWY